MLDSTSTMAAIFGLGTGELVVIFLIMLLLFGGANLPKLTRSLGKSVKEFKGALKEREEDDDDKPVTDESGK